MKFSFDKTKSEIYDFFFFPLLAYGDIEVIQKEIDIEKEIIDESQIEFFDQAKRMLGPYFERIKKFYHHDIFENKDIANIIFRSVPLDKVINSKDFLNCLRKIDLKSFKRNLIEYIKSINSENIEIPVKTEDLPLELINRLNVDPGLKWNLLILYQEPQVLILELYDLLNELLPLFESLYNKNKEMIEKTGIRLSTYLNENPFENLARITNNNISTSFIENEYCEIYISLLFSYSLSILNHSDKSTIVWGNELEKSFQKLKKINEDKFKSRVRVFKALGDKTRHETLRLLSSGKTSTKEIAQILNVSSATISYHLNEFLTAGIISLGKVNDKSAYVVNYDNLNTIIEDFKKDLNFE